MRGDRLSGFERASGFEVGSYAGCAESRVANSVRRVGCNHLAGDELVKTHADCGQMLFDGGLFVVAQ